MEYKKIAKIELYEAIQDIEYNNTAEGAGPEDHRITDRYDAMKFEWESAMKKVIETINNIS